MELRHDQPREETMDHKNHTGDSCHNHDLALRLQKLCRWKVDSVCKDLWDHVNGEYPCRGRDCSGLTYKGQDWSRKDIDQRKEESGYAQNNPRAL